MTVLGAYKQQRIREYGHAPSGIQAVGVAVEKLLRRSANSS